MKDTDKVTLTFGQLKKLIKESKQVVVNEALYNGKHVPAVAYSTLDKKLGTFDHIQRDNNMISLWFINGVVYCPTRGSLRDFPLAIAINDDRIYFNAQPDYFNSLDASIKYFEKFEPVTLNSYLEDNKVGVISFGVI